ncbi:MAG: T9SS type A sorting domain-containing protein [Sphingobacteriales bacterium]|jgi:hypothetical protein|nr:T9SS type A sorting domain-containing protein [Sphingobacteriales bacterium]
MGLRIYLNFLMLLLFITMQANADLVRRPAALPSGLSGSDQVLVYPNPFTEATTLTYRAEKTGFARIGITDSQGKMMAELLDDLVEEGEVYQFSIDGSSMRPGTYWYTVACSGSTIWKKIEIIR